MKYIHQNDVIFERVVQNGTTFIAITDEEGEVLWNFPEMTPPLSDDFYRLVVDFANKAHAIGFERGTLHKEALIKAALGIKQQA